MPAKQTDSEQHEPGEEQGLRLQKYLAAAGLGSRRRCEEYIAAGRVEIDGERVRDLGVRVDPRNQTVRVDGDVVKPQPKRYYLLNKPPGYVSTNRDPAGRPRAIDLVPEDDSRLFTVGRLDENSRGLLLVTNDGELANRLAHPRYGLERKYRVQVAGRPSPETLEQLKKGMYFTEGKFRVQAVKVVGTQGKSAFLELTLTEGRNREIRRLLARVGHKVINLQRIGFGPLQLGRLPEGRYRALTSFEMKALREFVAGGGPRQRKTGPRHEAPAERPRGGKSPAARGGKTPARRGGKAPARGGRPAARGAKAAASRGRKGTRSER